MNRHMRGHLAQKISILLSATLVALFVVPSSTVYAKTITREQYMNDKKIESLELDSDVTAIGDRAYYGCTNLKSVIIPEGVKTIGESAFAMCPNLDYVSIPSTVKTIKPGAFAGDTSLKTLVFPHGNSNFYFLAGALYNRKGTKLISYLPGKEYHFYDMPDSIKEVDKYAFWGSKNLEKVYVSPNVPSITPYDFAYCSGLKYVYLPESVKSIQEYAFRDCINLEYIYSENRNLKVDPTAFKLAGKAKTVSGANLDEFNAKCVIDKEDEEAKAMIAEAINHQDNNMSPSAGASANAAGLNMTPEEWGRYVAKNSHFTMNNYKARLNLTDSIAPVSTGDGSASQNAAGQSTGNGSDTATSSSAANASGTTSSSAAGSGTATSSSTQNAATATSSSSAGAGGTSTSSTGTGGGTGTSSSNAVSTNAPAVETPGPVTIINENYYFSTGGNKKKSSATPGRKSSSINIVLNMPESF